MFLHHFLNPKYHFQFYDLLETQDNQTEMSRNLSLFWSIPNVEKYVHMVYVQTLIDES